MSKSRSKFAEGASAELLAMVEAGQIEEWEFNQGATWAAVDLDPYKAGEKVVEPPQFFMRDDGMALVYPGRPHVFFGESESLKSWAALAVCCEVVTAGLTALFVDFEGSEASFVERCRLVGVPEEMVGDSLRYVRPSRPLTGVLAKGAWAYEVEQTSGLIILDGVSEAYALHGWNINSAEDAANFQRVFAVDGPASIAIDHTAKEAGRGVLGSQHKRAGLDGAEYEFRSRVRGGRGGESMAEVHVTKDRHGHVREWASGLVGKFWVRPSGATLETPSRKDLKDPRDDALAKVLAFVEANPGLSGNEVTDGVGMKKTRVVEALRTLEANRKVINEGTRSRQAWVVPDQAG